MLEYLIKTFIIFFVVVEPISLVPMFGALTRGAEPRYRRRMAVKGVILSAIIFYGFVVAGDWLLGTLGVTLDSFKIAGGVLMFLLAVDMVFARQSGLRSTTVREQDEARYKEDISVFPLAFPLIAGPGALATLLLLVGDARHRAITFVALLVIVMLVLAITLALLLATRHVERVLGVTGANVVSRLSGVVLVALSVQYVVDGIRGSFADLIG
jgi:multiple antibiotic resistance protein